MEKLDRLKNILGEITGAVVAFSGGVDSTLLTILAHKVLGDRMLAVTAVSPTYPEEQLEEAREIAARYGFALKIIQTDEFEEPDFIANPPDRCYYCKSALFRELRRIADSQGFSTLMDGANLDDLGDHRPGHRAAHEYGVRSPLQEAELTKADIRIISHDLDLPTWNKPAYACLASRIPYGRQITREALSRIDLAERFLKSLGLREVRVRDHHPVARVEVNPAELNLAWLERAMIARELHAIGFPYVTLDLDGFRSGSMNAVLAAEQRES